MKHENFTNLLCNQTKCISFSRIFYANITKKRAVNLHDSPAPNDILLIDLIQMKIPPDLCRIHRINKGTGIDLMDCINHIPPVSGIYNRVNHLASVSLKAALCIHNGGTVGGQIVDPAANLLGTVGHNKEGDLLIFAVQHTKGLGTDILENNGIQCLIPSKEKSCCSKDHHIDAKNHREGILSFFPGKINCNKIRSTTGGIPVETDGNGHCIHDPAKHTDQKGVMGHLKPWDHIHQKTAHQNHQNGKQGELLTDMLESNIGRYGIDNNIQECKRDIKSKISLTDGLDQHGKPCCSTGIDPSHLGKHLQIHRHESGTCQYHKEPFDIAFFKFHKYFLAITCTIIGYLSNISIFLSLFLCYDIEYYYSFITCKEITMSDNTPNLRIRPATEADADRILAIYSYYVENTSVTYEYEVPSLEEFTQRIQNTRKRYPYLVIEDEGVIMGYCYASSFHPRAAYQWCCELSIYLDKDARRCGMGRLLYQEMESLLKKMGFTNLYACIAFPEEEDAYLTRDSEKFHKKLGFTTVANFARCGYKFQNWYGMIWMEKIIGPHLKEQPPVLTYEELMQNS